MRALRVMAITEEFSNETQIGSNGTERGLIGSHLGLKASLDWINEVYCFSNLGLVCEIWSLRPIWDPNEV